MRKPTSPKPVSFGLADLFCGAGGTSTGAVEAIEALGFKASLTAINHWPVAVATHEVNHPNARHFCASLDALNPRELFKPGELKLLWASPECTHHSVARGGAPINDQSRATAWCVSRWAEALRPEVILIENVPEFRTWGPIGSNGRPMVSRRGETFQAWLNTLRALGYTVDHRVLVAADYGDPTTRRRLFVQAVRGRRKIVWPEPTHSPTAEKDLFGTRKPWVAAREIINWDMPGQSIYDRKRPLSEKTMRRIWAGLEKYGLKPFILPGQGDAGHQEPRTHATDKPLPTVTAQGHMHIAEPFLIPQHGTHEARSINKPAPTVTTTSRGVGLAQPVLSAVGDCYKCGSCAYFGQLTKHTNVCPKCSEKTYDNVMTVPSIGPRVGWEFDFEKQKWKRLPKSKKGTGKVMDPFLIAMEHGGRLLSVDDPMPTITTAKGGAIAVAQPFIMSAGGPECSPRGVDQPVGTVLTRDHRALVQPYIVPLTANNKPESVEKPLSTVTTGVRHAVARPYIVRLQHNNHADSVDKPLGTVMAGGTHFGLAQPFLVQVAHGNGKDKNGDKRRAKPLSAPLPTVCGERGEYALVEPALLPQQGGGQLRPVSEPAPTVATAGAIGLVEPFIVEYYGNGGAQSVHDPLGTATTKSRFGLARPIIVIDGQRYLLDIRFRMLQPGELAAAQGFRSDYKFTGNKTEQVKQIGNAVPRRLARSIVAAVLSQNPNISWVVDPESAAA